MDNLMDNPQVKYLAAVIDWILQGEDLKEQDWSL